MAHIIKLGDQYVTAAYCLSDNQADAKVFDTCDQAARFREAFERQHKPEVARLVKFKRRGCRRAY